MPPWYVGALRDYAVTAAATAAAMLLTYLLLRGGRVRREAAVGLALVVPWLIGFLAFNLGPFLASLYLAFTDYDVLTPPRWVGLDNFRRLASDPYFWVSLRLTVLYALLSVPLGVVGALCTALLLARDVRGVGFWRTLYYLPALLPAPATAMLWRWLLGPNGLVNAALAPVYRLWEAEPPRWFVDPQTVLPGYVLMSLWGIYGANTAILLAGLKNVPRELYEAAEVDGAGPWARFRHVTLPMVSPTVFYVLVMGLIGALQVFTQAFFVQTPRSAGTFLQVYIYEQGFGLLRMGYASAIAWVLMLLILALTLAVFRTSPLWVHYEAEREEAV